MRKHAYFFLAMIIMVLVLPLILSSFGTNLATEIFFMAVFALSLGLIMGYTGLVSLGHAAFFGTGAYTVALLGEHIGNTYVLLLAALVFSGLLALISGALFIRTTGGYFLMITLAFGQMLFAFAFKMKSWTGGADGMQISVSPDFGFGPITSTHGLYYLAGVGFLLCYLLLLLFVNSPIGKIVKGIMENETRMKALGYQTRNYKLIAYSLSGTLAGFGGALYAFINSFVSPDLMFWIFSGQALIMVIVGGVGTLLGPVVGVVFFIILQNYVSSYTERWQLIMGIIFVAFVLYGRGGIVQLVSSLWKKRPGKGEDANVAVENAKNKQIV
ncbi:branched-chain amino acid ABC transporter permease [Paenibacillus sp. EPM92]|uniref:branched-chain amino acid ABC transporter permease n=1 Tax=Paenibacillus sp. EPM92 TaxID=1561195 RepID=UPI001F22F6DF|nr:branched-chain amino acid ABC transporter permease [Paenibacillus sp. EPM92]